MVRIFRFNASGESAIAVIRIWKLHRTCRFSSSRLMYMAEAILFSRLSESALVALRVNMVLALARMER